MAGNANSGRRPYKNDFKRAITEAVSEHIPQLPMLTKNQSEQILVPNSLLVRNGLVDMVCWLRFCGFSQPRMAERLGVSLDCVRDFLKTPFFQRTYENKLAEMRDAVDQKARERVQEIVMEAIEFLYETMQNERVHRGVRVDIAKYFHGLGLKGIAGGARGPSDVIRAIYEKSITKRGEDGTETTIRAVLKGSPEAVGRAAHADQDAQAGSIDVGVESAPGSEGGSERTEETQEGAGGDGDHAGDGGGSAEPITKDVD